MNAPHAIWQKPLFLALVVLSVAGAACAGNRESLPSGAGAAGDSIQWSRPWHGEGKLVPSAADAQASLPFQMVTPRVPDGPRRIFLPPEHRIPQLMAVWFVYSSAQYGWVW